MTKQVLSNKRVLAVSGQRHVLTALEKEIATAAPTCVFDAAATFETASELLLSWSYDLLMLDIMSYRAIDFLERATTRGYPVPTVILTSHPYCWSLVRTAKKRGARAYIPLERLGNMVPCLEDVLYYEYGPLYRRVAKKIAGIFTSQWEYYWRRPEEPMGAGFALTH